MHIDILSSNIKALTPINFTPNIYNNQSSSWPINGKLNPHSWHFLK
jgi:hypothetical protein